MHDSGDFLVLHGKSGGANKGFGEAPKSCTRKEHEGASKLLFPQDSVKKRFFACKLQIPRKTAKSIRIFSETLLTNCLSFGILIKLNRFSRANMAQSVEQRFRKPQVEGSSPSVGSLFRGVAQFGSAFGSGPKGRGFESRHFDTFCHLHCKM